MLSFEVPASLVFMWIPQFLKFPECKAMLVTLSGSIFFQFVASYLSWVSDKWYTTHQSKRERGKENNSCLERNNRSPFSQSMLQNKDCFFVSFKLTRILKAVIFGKSFWTWMGCYFWLKFSTVFFFFGTAESIAWIGYYFSLKFSTVFFSGMAESIPDKSPGTCSK